MSARNTCQEITSKTSALSGFANFIRKLNPFSNTNDISNGVQTNLSVNLSSNDITDIKNSCQNISKVRQSNVMETSSQCIDLARDVCMGDSNPGACVRGILSNENITQKNELFNEQNCMIDSMISKISKQDASIDNISAMLALQNAKGIMLSNDANNAICTNINNSMSTNSFLNSYKDCLNKTSTIQENLLKNCSGRNITQGNFYKSLADCLQAENVISDSKKVVDVVNKTEVSSKQDNSILPFDLNYILIIIVVCVVCVVLSSLILMAAIFLK